MREFKVKLPMRIRTSAKKKQAMNLNVYRNLHFRGLSAQKKKFYKLAKKLLSGIPPLGVITLHYDVYPESKRRLDIMNVGSIVDKYFSDCLTAYGIIEDDDFKNIPKVSFAFGGLVKSEYVLVTITEIEPREEAMPMRVLLDFGDIQKALTTYVDSLGLPNSTGVELSADAFGTITAEVIFAGHPITDESPPEADVTETPKKRGRGGRPKGSKNLPKAQPEENADVDAPVQDSADISSTGDTEATEVEAPKSTETKAETSKPKSTSRKNLFGDKETPSSEDDGKAEAALDTPPVKKGSIFDS